MDPSARRSAPSSSSGAGASNSRSRSRARTVGALVARALSHRVTLAALDAKDARRESGAIALQACLGLGVAGMAGMMLNLILLTLVWDLPSRVVWLVLFLLCETVVAICVTAAAWRRLQRLRPFAGFIKQIKADYSCWIDSA